MERTRTTSRRPLLGITAALLTALAPVGASGATPTVCGTDDGTGCAPTDARVDLATPVFSDPTAVTNPLHPSANLRSALLMGVVDDLPFRVEVTLLPGRKTIEVDGVPVEALESQYMAFLGGRIHEVALDWYVQADDGSVWYLGEDVFNYEDGVVADTEGTWLTGRDGPAAMIMPSDPQVGDVYRPENIPGVVFEEVVVRQTGLRVDTPHGPVMGAIEIEELHMDGSKESKLFAPGYGEFATGAGTTIEAIALAVPTDALDGPVPETLGLIVSGAKDARDAVEAEEWTAAGTAFGAVTEAWGSFRLAGVPTWLDAQMNDAIDALRAGIEDEKPIEARIAAIAVARASLDLQLRHRDPAMVDVDRFGLWLDQVVVDADADHAGAVAGDVASLEWTRDRFTDAIDASVATEIDAGLEVLRAAVDAEDLAAAAKAAARLLEITSGIDTGA